jgi:HlyD family secretion protein
MKKWTWIIIAVALIAAVGGIWLLTRPKASADKTKESYDLATVSRGSIESVVSSSGTLSAVSTVSILSQMSGRVEKVHADYNDHVKKGQVLVELNTNMLKLQKKESEAAVRKAQANYDLQLLDVQNKTQLALKGLISDYEFKTSKTTLEVYAAELASAQSALDVIQTQLNQYALITSPIDGIVIDRNVDVGQSVVEGSSANASSLFTLAEDLSRMEIKAEVDELDIASIKTGQEVRFTVEANPSATFNGKVHEIRLVPETTDNVVNYSVMIDADNKEGKLLPGMTAEVQFIKENRQNVLTVPSAALRFQPAGLSDQEIQQMIFAAGLADLPADQREAAQKIMEAAKAAGAAAGGDGTKTQARGLAGMMMPMGPPPGSRNNANAAAASGLPAAQDKKALWYLDGSGKLAVRMVKTGASNGTSTEIIGADDLEGKTIIVKTKVE